MDPQHRTVIMRKTTGEVYVCLPDCLEGAPRPQHWEGDPNRAQQPCWAEGQIRVQGGRGSQNLQDRMSKTGRCTELQRPSVDIAWRHVGGCLWLRVCRGNWLYRKAGELLGWRKCFRSWLWWQLTRLETFVKTPWIVHLKLVILYVNYISTRSHPKESSSKIAWRLEII